MLFRSMDVFILVGVIATSACTKRQSFDDAIAKHRDTLVDQVNTSEAGVPFYTIETLNPVWNLSEKTPIVKIPDISLIDQDSRRHDSQLFSGKISVVGFFFATCTGFCPFLVDGMKGIERNLGDKDADIKFVALSVNPETDTPEHLTRYAKERTLNTKQRWTLLTGDKSTIYSLAKKTFASQIFKRQVSETSFVHSEHLYVIDSQKRLRGILNGTRLDVQKSALELFAKLRNEQKRSSESSGEKLSQSYH